MDFYKRDGGPWDFYVSGGDGSLQGTCYKNDANWASACGGAEVHVSDWLVCYSYICGPDLELRRGSGMVTPQGTELYISHLRVLLLLLAKGNIY
jgi:hypothetical protein